MQYWNFACGYDSDYLHCLPTWKKFKFFSKKNPEKSYYLSEQLNIRRRNQNQFCNKYNNEFYNVLLYFVHFYKTKKVNFIS